MKRAATIFWGALIGASLGAAGGGLSQAMMWPPLDVGNEFALDPALRPWLGAVAGMVAGLVGAFVGQPAIAALAGVAAAAPIFAQGEMGSRAVAIGAGIGFAAGLAAALLRKVLERFREAAAKK